MMFIQKMDMRTSSDIQTKWNDMRTLDILPKSDGYANKFGYNLLYAIWRDKFKEVKQYK